MLRYLPAADREINADINTGPVEERDIESLYDTIAGLFSCHARLGAP